MKNLDYKLRIIFGIMLICGLTSFVILIIVSMFNVAMHGNENAADYIVIWLFITIAELLLLGIIAVVYNIRFILRMFFPKNSKTRQPCTIHSFSSTLNADKQTPTFDEWLHKFFKDVEQTITYADKNSGQRYTIDELRRWYMRTYKVSI